MENNKEQILEVLKALSNKVRLDIVFYLISGAKSCFSSFRNTKETKNYNRKKRRKVDTLFFKY